MNSSDHFVEIYFIMLRFKSWFFIISGYCYVILVIFSFATLCFNSHANKACHCCCGFSSCCCCCCCSWVGGDHQQLTRDRRYRCFISFSLWKSVIRQIFCPRNTLQTECFPYQSIIRQGIIRSQGWKHNEAWKKTRKKCSISIMNAYQLFFRTF